MKHIKLTPCETIVDARYQRDLDTRRVEAITSAYNASLVGVPVVSKREDGSYVRVDGQHRLAANIQAGFGDLPIMMEVHEGLSLREEATLFLRLNGGRTSVGAINKYKARLVAEEPDALSIRAILKGVGCKITSGPQRGGVMAVQAVEHAFHKGNLEPTMKALFAWLDGEPDAFDGELIRAVSAFLVVYPEADPLHLARNLESFAPARLSVRLRRERQELYGSKSDAARFVLTEIYNRKTPRLKRVGPLQTAGKTLSSSASNVN